MDTVGLSIQGKYGYKEGGEIMTSILTCPLCVCSELLVHVKCESTTSS